MTKCSGGLNRPTSVCPHGLETTSTTRAQRRASSIAFSVSDDGNLLAYSTDVTGYRQFTLHFKDLRTGEVLKENIERVGSVVWATDNKTLFYTTEDAVSKRSNRFYRHVVGGEASDLLYEEKDELFDVFAARSRDKKIIFLTSFAKTSREARYLPADSPAAELKMVLPREAGHEYDVDHASLPLTTSEYIEWGNPNRREEFEYMIKYSPYDNVAPQKYPAMLVQVSLNDSQVPYWEGTKFAAKVRAMKTDTNPLLVKANMGAGHGGSSGRYDALRETAFTYAFMLWQMGLVSNGTSTAPSGLPVEDLVLASLGR